MVLVDNVEALSEVEQSSPPPEWQDYLVGRAATHPLFRRRQLGVFGGKGYVVLTGTVTSFYEKQVAQEFVRRCQGVRQIDNRIEVSYASDQP
jgi:osmotically-inducible protein OsmY